MQEFDELDDEWRSDEYVEIENDGNNNLAHKTTTTTTTTTRTPARSIDRMSHSDGATLSRSPEEDEKVNQELYDKLVGMGFSEEQARSAVDGASEV